MPEKVTQLPPTRDFPPIAMDASVLLPIRGWHHGQRVYAWARRRDPDGKWQSLVLHVPTAGIEHAWPCDTQDEAIGIAAQEYAKAAYGLTKNPAIVAGVLPPADGVEN